MWTGLSVFLLFISGAAGQVKRILSAADFQEQIQQPGIQLLDVRTSQEYKAGHIKSSLQADWLNQKQFTEQVKHLDKTTALYIYCGSGVRSNDAGRWLRKDGFKEVFELQNGMIAWKKSQYPIESETITKQMTMDEYQSILDSSSVVLINFGAKWCPPCKKMEPVLEKLQNDLRGQFVLFQIDAGIHADIMRELKVEMLPTFIVYKNARETWRKDGLATLDEIKSHLK